MTDKWQKIAEEAQKIEQEAPQPDQPSEQAVPAAEEGQLGFASRQELEDQLNVLEHQVDEWKRKALAAQAEAENTRRRAQRDVEEAHKFGVKDLIVSLFPAMEALLHGLKSGDDADPKVKPLHDGMRLTLELLHKALTKFGVEVIDPAVGDSFNPALHEAVGMHQQPGFAPNTIVQVLQRGYQLQGRVLRAAMVMVAA